MGDSTEYQGRRRRRVGLLERIRNIGFLPLLAAVLVTAVLFVIAFRMAKSPVYWNSAPPVYAAPTELEPTIPPPVPATEEPSPTPSPSRSPSPSPPPAPQGQRYEAESTTISQGRPDNKHAGFSGTGFVDYENVVGGYVEWRVSAAAAGKVTLKLRYANGTAVNRPMDIVVNGATVASGVAFEGTGAWTNWQTRTVTVTLNAGVNVIRAVATSPNGGPNVDYLEI